MNKDLKKLPKLKIQQWRDLIIVTLPKKKYKYIRIIV